jgi:SSS family transporter
MLKHLAVFTLALCTYLGLVLAFALTGRKQRGTEEDFLTGGRNLGPWVGGAALSATQISAGTMMGTLGRHYATGVSWVWVWPGVWFGWLVSAVFIGPKLRTSGAITIPDYLGKRFDSQVLRVLSALFIVIVYVTLLTAQYQACGVIFETSFGVKPVYTTALLVATTLIYTLLGGIRVSSYIDLLQISIVIAGLLIAAPILLRYSGGLQATSSFLTLLNPRLTGQWYSWQQLFATQIVFGLAVATSPNEMTRFYSMRDRSTVRYAIGVSFIFQAVISIGVLLVGILVRSIFPYLPSADQASPLMAASILPSFAGSFFLVALLSAIMSNVNSSLLVSGAAISHDIYVSALDPQASEKRKLLINRVSTAVLSLIPIWFALHALADIQSIVAAAARLVGCCFFVPIVLGLNSRFGSASGAILSMIGGTCMSLLWEKHLHYVLPALDAAEVGILTSLGIYLLVGSLTPQVSAKTVTSLFGED